MNTKIDGDLCHTLLTKKTVGKLSFNEQQDYNTWKQNVKNKLVELLGLDKIACNACEINLVIESDEILDDYRQIRFVFESEVGAHVPCYLLVPKMIDKKVPVGIILQGHSSGFHNSIGVAKSDSDKEYIETRGDFGRQAVKNGYAALCIEQRAMGERTTNRHSFGSKMCTYQALTAFMLGRTLLGERIWDIQKAIDCLSNFDMIDTDKIFITGNSGGGTMSYYAACIEERIKFTAPSCAFCSYETSIMDIYHCSCNYIPDAFNWFEMQDLACLIAPRNLLVFAGIEDKIFPIDGVKSAFKTVESIYNQAGVSDNCKLVITDKGHWWCKDLVWEEIKILSKKLGW